MRGLTQEEVAGLDMATRTFQRIECAEISPSLKSIFKIARNMDVSPMEFFRFDFNYRSDPSSSPPENENPKPETLDGSIPNFVNPL